MKEKSTLNKENENTVVWLGWWCRLQSEFGQDHILDLGVLPGSVFSSHVAGFSFSPTVKAVGLFHPGFCIYPALSLYMRILRTPKFITLTANRCQTHIISITKLCSWSHVTRSFCCHVHKHKHKKTIVIATSNSNCFCSGHGAPSPLPLSIW
jgi:hypothetical protein